MVALESLDRIPFFHKLAPAERALIAPIASAREHRAGEVIFAEGDVPKSLRVLQRGLVAFRQKQKSGGEEVTMGSVGELGDVFGIAAIVGDQRTHPHSAVCLEDSDVIEIDGAQFLALCEREPKLGLHVLQQLTAVMAMRLAAAREQIRSRIRPGLISHG